MVLQAPGNSGCDPLFRAAGAIPFMVQAPDESVPEGIDLCGRDHLGRLDDTGNGQGLRKIGALPERIGRCFAMIPEGSKLSGVLK